jgi:hypothetical protein
MRILIAIASVLLLLVSGPAVFAESSSNVIELQKALAELGYDPGPADGLLGQKTRDAIKAYQNDHKMHPDGKFSGLLLFNVQGKLLQARQAATPEGRAKESERQSLLSLTDSELIKRIESADKKDIDRIFNLVGEKRAKNLPARLLEEFLKNADGTKNAVGLVDKLAAISLQVLMYPPPPKGVEQFQTDLGVPTTGELTFGQFEELNRRSTRFKDTPVYVGGWNTNIYVAAGVLATVSGTWVIEGEKIAFPINKSEITCKRASKECKIVQANLSVPGIEKGGDSYNLDLTVSTYEIVSWTSEEILARTSGSCRSSLLTLNLKAHEVFETIRNNDPAACREQPLSLPPLDAPRISRLVPSWDVTYKFWQARKKIASEWANPRYRQNMGLLLESLQDKKIAK